MKQSSAKERYIAMRGHYKTLVSEYMRRRWVSPRDVMAPTSEQKLSKVIWATYHVPVLFVGMLANDEVFIDGIMNGSNSNSDSLDGNGMGWNAWDPMSNEMPNYRWIQ